MFGFLILCLGIAAVASADPIRLTTGTMEANDDFVGSFSLAGNGFAANGTGFGAPTLDRFAVGPLDVSGEFTIFSINSPDNAHVTAGGQTLAGFISVSFQVLADPIVVGDFGPGRQLFSTPFTASGLVRLTDEFGGGSQLFSQALIGSGTLSFAADTLDQGRFAARNMALTFSPEVSATPEPGSLVLLGTGVIAAWKSRRFRRGD